METKWNFIVAHLTITPFIGEWDRGNLAWVMKPIINVKKPRVVDEDALLMKADNMKAKPSCIQSKQNG